MPRSPTSSRESPPASQCASTPKHAPKLRLSCNACSAAKVKCSKEHPCCKKCVANDTLCIYSTSQKFGKHKKRNINPEAESTAQNIMPDRFPSQRRSDPPILQQDFAPDMHLPFEDLMQDVVDNSGFIRSWSPGADMSAGWNPNSSITMPSGPQTGYRTSLVDDSRVLSHQLNPVALSFDGAYAGLDLSIGRTAEDFGDQTCGTFSTTSIAQDLASVLREGGSDSTGPSTASTLPLHDAPSSANDPFHLLSAPHDPSATRDCQAFAYSTLADLQCRTSPPRQGQDASSPSSSSSYHCLGPHDKIIPTLDNVLCTNRIAVGNVSQLLTCPCALDPHLAMLYASITSRILSRYEVTASIKIPSSSPATTARAPEVPALPELSHQSSHRTLGTDLAIGSKPSATHVPPTYGSFSLDEQDQEALRQTLLLSELRKAGQLIDQMASLNGDVTEYDAQAGGDVSDLYAKLSAWLKSELWRTIRKVKEGGCGQMT